LAPKLKGKQKTKQERVNLQGSTPYLMHKKA